MMVQYVQVATDIFSRFAYCQAIKGKKGVDIIKALQVILKRCRKPKAIRTDRGIEFRSREVNEYLKTQNIHHFYALNKRSKQNIANG